MNPPRCRQFPWCYLKKYFNLHLIKKASETGLVDGVTTNPSIIAKSGKKFKEVLQEICQIVPGPVSAEGNAETLDDMIGALASRAPTAFRKLMEEGGIPLILRLRKSTEQDAAVLIIDQIVAQGWNPLAPDMPR